MVITQTFFVKDDAEFIPCGVDGKFTRSQTKGIKIK